MWTNDNFTARSVIAPGPDLRIDEVWLSYPCLCGLLQQRIINILHKSYFMKYNDAYKLLLESMHHENKMIRQIIEGIIASYPRGIPLLINRNPTISYGVAEMQPHYVWQHAYVSRLIANKS